MLVVAILSAQAIYSQSEITTEKLILTDGATTDFILRSDASGNATWVDPSTMFSSETSNWTFDSPNLYNDNTGFVGIGTCLLYTSPSPRDRG